MESHINKLHKYFLYKEEGEFSLTVQWNLSGVLFMCVTVCLHCPALPSLQMGRTPGLRQLYSCHTTCLSLGFMLCRTYAGYLCVHQFLFVCLWEWGMPNTALSSLQPALPLKCDEFKDGRKGWKPRRREKTMTNGHGFEPPVIMSLSFM